jgi:SAM-dependent methyltransferase
VEGYRGTEGTRPYAGAGWYYAEYRENISREFLGWLAARLGWGPGDRVLDLGAGPAPLSILTAPHVAEVVAVDPEPDMLDEGRRRARAAGIGNITFVLASSDDLPALRGRLGTFRAALMGQAFHWMLERDRVLADIGAMCDPERAAVALIWCERVSAAPELREMTDLVHELLMRHLRDVPEGPHPRGRHDPFDELLARSPFPHVELVERVYEARVRPTVESLVGAEYSISHVLARLGERRAAFERDVSTALGDIGGVALSVVRRDAAYVGMR